MPRKKRPEGTRAPNGASSIYYSEYEKCWVGRVTMGVRDNGKPDRRTRKRKTETEIIAAVRELERQRDSGKVRKAGSPWKLDKWLVHWLDNVITPTVRPKTAARYRTDIKEYLLPGLGGHRIDKLTPEHIEKLYASLRARKPPLSPSSIYHVHATLRTSLNEAVKRRHIGENPVLIARPPQLVEPEIVPLTVEEARRILTVAQSQRNGLRFALALAVGLRQGEAIGSKWSDLELAWKHGCGDVTCERQHVADVCPRRTLTTAVLTVRRALQRQTWQHGCTDPHRCGEGHHKTKPCRDGCKAHTRACPPPCRPDCTDHARHCPERQSGGLVEVETKSRAGRRSVSLPAPLQEWLVRHRAAQDQERTTAGDLWQAGDWLFTQPNGRPIDPRADYQEWRDLLTAADVRPARLHDARHTAATMLLVLKVPVRAAMGVMGWSEASMASRYMHVPDELRHEIANQVAGLLWSTPVPGPAGDGDVTDEYVPLAADQRAAVLMLASALPEYWRKRIARALDDGGNPPAAA